MKIVSIEEWELLGFFEVEPILRDEGEPWLYNDALYTITRNEISLSFALAPSYKDVRIILKNAKSNIYELNATGVYDVVLKVEKDKEILKIKIKDNESIRLVVKPNIEISQIIENL